MRAVVGVEVGVELAVRIRRVVLVLSAAVLGVGVLAAVPASGAPPSRIVVDGQARFEVLSPTLIRLEYSGDHHFDDAATFNAIGRDTFAVPPYRRSVDQGWRIIRTDKVTLKYREGSGPFTADNVELDLRDGGYCRPRAPVVATQATCAFGALCEAENAALSGGASVNTDHAGYTGAGFVAGIQTKGAQFSDHVTGVAAGTYDLQLRYANDLGGDGQRTTRTMSVAVDGQAAGTLTLPVTGSWDTWALTSLPLQLAAGCARRHRRVRARRHRQHELRQPRGHCRAAPATPVRHRRPARSRRVRGRDRDAHRRRTYRE